MQPHIKLLHIITTSTVKKRKSLMLQHKDDKLLGSLIELMCSPEYKHGYDFDIEYPQKAPTVPTDSTFVKFRSMLYRKDKNLINYLESLDSATQFVYSHICNQTDLKVSFKFIADTFTLFNRFNHNEHYIDYGFPEIPCHIQVMPKDRQMINIKVNDIVTATYLDGRYYKDINIGILEQFPKLHLKGDFTGYILDNVYYITNYYPNGDHTFAKRILVVESALLRVGDLPNIELVKAFTLSNHKFLHKYLIKDHEIICKQDILPVFGKSKNMIALDCNTYIKLNEVNNER